MSLLRTRINLAAVTANTRQIAQSLGPNTQLMAVVKADGYNHGAAQVAGAMAEGGANCFGVATIPEAVSLRNQGITEPILAWIWDARETDLLTDAIASGIDLGVPSMQHLHSLIELEVPAKIYVEVETGMHRSGIDADFWADAFELLKQAPQIKLLGVSSHFACADEPDNPANNQQLAAFEQAISLGRELGHELPINHIANSAATLEIPRSHHDLVRVGIALYGLEPGAGDHGLQPAMTWSADVVNIKYLRAGESVSYGHTYTAAKDEHVALIPAGYADGLPRGLSGQLHITIDGIRYPQVGRVCMDQIVVSLGENPANIKQGDEAIIFGPGTQGEVTIDECAEALGTINYEVVNLPSGRTVRTFVRG